ncbi:MAG: 16S rRNA (adenine(1518)-N(6)/adenine(1519)-N(6))-dimethyltransferase RsmA [Candidatus Buchananbacteria bacterium]
MESENLKLVKEITRLYNIAPARSKGQNFLINSQVIEKIIAAANLASHDSVLEVGPGLGILTESLIKKAKMVVSVELDRKLFDFLKIKFIKAVNLELINQDILFLSQNRDWLSRLGDYKIVANLPYNITSVFLRNFLTAENAPQEIVLLLQKEVVERICAQPGQLSLLAISVQLYGQAELIDYVPKSDFWPQPEIDSAILRIRNIKSKAERVEFFSEVSENIFWQIVKMGFSAKRKQLQHNLAAGLKISQAEAKKCLAEIGLDQKVRAQNLTIAQWFDLAKSLKIYFK